MVEDNVSPVDPEELLKTLDSQLGTDGEIKGIEEAEKIVGMMKEADKLVSRCIYLNILQATTNNAILEKLIDIGGWDMLNRWLKDAKAAENFPMLIEILKVYSMIPVDIDLLKKNSCAKTIKQLSRSDNEDLKKLASEIVEEWTKSIKRKDNTTDKSSKKKDKKHSHHHHKKDKESPKSASKSSSKELVDENSNDSTSTSDSIQSAQNNIVSKHSNSASPSTGIKTRPKSVKAQMSKSKSTGLEVEIPPAKKKSPIDKSAVKRPR